jgi:hypothetical protein
MAKIIIHRKPAFAHRFRPIEVFIDGVKAGMVKNDDTQEFPVSPGYHKVHCKMGWYYSEAFNATLGSDEIKFLHLKHGPRFLGVVYAVLVIALITPIVSRSASWYDAKTFEMVRLAALVFIIAHGLYYNFFARKQYLKINEDKDNIFNH